MKELKSFGEKIRLVTTLDPSMPKEIKTQRLLLTCASISELPSTMNTMPENGFIYRVAIDARFLRRIPFSMSFRVYEVPPMM